MELTEIPEWLQEALAECDLSLWSGRLQYARICAGQRRAAVAAAANVSRPTVQDWEEHQVQKLAGDRARAISAFLNCSTDWLLFGTGDPPKPDQKALKLREEKRMKTWRQQPTAASEMEQIFAVAQEKRKPDIIEVVRWLVTASPDAFNRAIDAVHTIVTTRGSTK